MRSGRVDAAAWGYYLLLSVALTWPLLPRMSTALSSSPDSLLNAWALGWSFHILPRDPLSLFDANIFFPRPDTLAYSEHLFGITLLTLAGIRRDGKSPAHLQRRPPVVLRALGNRDVSPGPGVNRKPLGGPRLRHHLPRGPLPLRTPSAVAAPHAPVVSVRVLVRASIPPRGQAAAARGNRRLLAPASPVVQLLHGLSRARRHPLRAHARGLGP